MSEPAHPIDSQRADPTAPQKRHRRRLLFGCLFALIACVSIAAGALVMFLNAFADGLGEMFADNCATDVPDHILRTEGLANFEFPPSAANIWTSCGGLQGWWAEARFEMSPVDLDAFIQSTRIRRLQLTTSAPADLQGSNPLLRDVLNVPEPYLYGYYSSGSDYLQEVFIDTSDPNLYRVHILLSAG
ncbi:MAG: hypothetical protein U0694_06020 [Anaerolineae bacterium]